MGLNSVHENGGEGDCFKECVIFEVLLAHIYVYIILFITLFYFKGSQTLPMMIRFQLIQAIIGF